jgi:hypothetical protein
MWSDESRPFRTRHSRVRQQQRGKTNSAVSLLFAYCDLSARGRNGCAAVQLSRGLIEELKAEGYSPQVIDAARRTTMILSPGEDVMTVYRSASISQLRKRHTKCLKRFSHLR